MASHQIPKSFDQMMMKLLKDAMQLNCDPKPIAPLATSDVPSEMVSPLRSVLRTISKAKNLEGLLSIWVFRSQRCSREIRENSYCILRGYLLMNRKTHVLLSTVP